eukprot:TRINITY_DN688_c0_g2_i12.p1 TRINITY_DN688_c0_g2~~TRINITY_DN688_c0_g2_i12.p1  ORF type:complete len:277 (+),score=-37.45 TRINITY_DN688_c0_g2_i12:597-1427(+)
MVAPVLLLEGAARGPIVGHNAAVSSDTAELHLIIAARGAIPKGVHVQRHLQLLPIITHLQLLPTTHLQLLPIITHLQLLPIITHLQLLPTTHLQLLTIITHLQLLSIITHLQLLPIITHLQILPIPAPLKLTPASLRTTMRVLKSEWDLSRGTPMWPVLRKAGQTRWAPITAGFTTAVTMAWARICISPALPQVGRTPLKRGSARSLCTHTPCSMLPATQDAVVAGRSAAIIRKSFGRTHRRWDAGRINAPMGQRLWRATTTLRAISRANTPTDSQ